MKKSEINAMLSIDKENALAKSMGKSCFTIKKFEHIAGKVYRTNELFQFIIDNFSMYENAAIIEVRDLFGIGNKSISIPVYGEPKIRTDVRYFIGDREVFVDEV